MARMITVSLPVSDLNAARDFYTALGFVNNAEYSDDTGAFMVWSESISIALLTREKWRTFTTRPIPPTTSSEVALNLTCDSREQVDAMNQAAIDHGGTGDINPVQDLGFMYGRDFLDLDGHVIGGVWMDMSTMSPGTA